MFDNNNYDDNNDIHIKRYRAPNVQFLIYRL